MRLDLFSAQSPTITLAVPVGAAASASTPLPGQGNSLRIVNENTAVVYISVGTGVQTATLPTGTAKTSSTPIGAGGDVIFSIPSTSILNISVISASVAGSIDISVGEGT